MNRTAVLFLCAGVLAGLGCLSSEVAFLSPALADELQAGEKLYGANCASCHPKGGNIINSAIPVLGSPQLKDPDTFIRYNRNPLKQDGSKGMMPPFPEQKLSDKELTLIYQYIVKGLAAKK